MFGEKKYFVLALVVIFFSGIPLVFAQDTSPTSPTIPPYGLLLIYFLYRSINKKEKKAVESQNGKKVGVDGWLLFFIGLVFIFGILGIVGSLIDIGTTVYYMGYYQIDWVFYLFSVIFQFAVSGFLIYSAYLAYNVKPNARNMVIFALILDSIHSLYVIMLPGVEGNGLDIFVNIANVLGIIYNAIILTYFLVSKRVKNTYSKTAHLPKPLPENKSSITNWLAFLLILNVVIALIVGFASAGNVAEIAKSSPPLGTSEKEISAMSGEVSAFNKWSSAWSTFIDSFSKAQECDAYLPIIQKYNSDLQLIGAEIEQSVITTTTVVQSETCLSSSSQLSADFGKIVSTTSAYKTHLETACQGIAIPNGEAVQKKLLDDIDAANNSFSNQHEKQIQTCFPWVTKEILYG